MAEKSGEMRWLPLESNPDVMNKYIENLGASTDWGFHDIFGLDPDLLMMVPKPVAAVMLLYPISEKSESESIGELEDNKDLFFMKQTVGNACGTVGIIHALANNRDRIPLDETKPLAKFLSESQAMTHAERATALGNDKNIGWCIADILKSAKNKTMRELSRLKDTRAAVMEISYDLGAAHESSAKEGQTEAPDVNERVNLHFVALVHCGGGLYELDGRKDKPTRHGDTTPDTLLEDAAAVAKKFMLRDPSEVNFTLTALALN